MTLSMHNLKPARGAKSQPKRVGRGNASGKGTTAGRGGKGQKARTGGRNRLKLLGMRRLMLSTPKLRGFKSHHAKDAVVRLDIINAEFTDGAKVTPAALVKKGIIGTARNGVKILGGSLKKKIIVIGCLVSAAAKETIVAAGGEVRA